MPHPCPTPLHTVKQPPVPHAYKHTLTPTCLHIHYPCKHTEQQTFNTAWWVSKWEEGGEGHTSREMYRPTWLTYCVQSTRNPHAHVHTCLQVYTVHLNDTPSAHGNVRNRLTSHPMHMHTGQMKHFIRVTWSALNLVKIKSEQMASWATLRNISVIKHFRTFRPVGLRQLNSLFSWRRPMSRNVLNCFMTFMLCKVAQEAFHSRMTQQ